MLDAANTIQLLIIDNQKIVAEALQQVLPSHGSFRVATASSIAEMRAKLSSGTYDLVLLGYTAKEIQNPGALEQIVQECSPTRVALFSYDLESRYVEEALNTGVCGYVPKSMGIQALIACVELLMSGERYVPANYINAISANVSVVAQDNVNIHEFDREIISLIGQGKTNNQIGQQFGMPESKVKMLLRALSAKLQAHNRAHLVSIARSLNII